MKGIVTTTILIAARISVSACNVTTKQTGIYSDEASSQGRQVNSAGIDSGNFWDSGNDQNDGAAVITSGQSAQPAFQVASSGYARGSADGVAAPASRGPSSPISDHNKEDDLDAADEAQSRQNRDANGNLDKDASPDKDVIDRPVPSGTEAESTQGTSYGLGDPNENGDHDPNADKDGPGQREATHDSDQGGPDKDAPAPDKEVDEQTLPQSPEHDKDGDPVDGSDHDKDGGAPAEGGQPAQTDYSGMQDKDGGPANPQPSDFDKD